MNPSYSFSKKYQGAFLTDFKKPHTLVFHQSVQDGAGLQGIAGNSWGNGLGKSEKQDIVMKMAIPSPTKNFGGGGMAECGVMDNEAQRFY